MIDSNTKKDIIKMMKDILPPERYEKWRKEFEKEIKAPETLYRKLKNYPILKEGETHRITDKIEIVVNEPAAEAQSILGGEDAYSRDFIA
ncbi:MAG: hypothetical protein AB1798_22550, partial [Spirochaetota bacterium]